MSLLCSLTGQVAAHPMLNPKSGRVYEKHMIEQHLLTSSTDPVTHDPLTLSDLIAINPASLALPPFLSSPSSASLSLSSLLSSLQREYDGLILEQFNLKREVHSLKQELAHALYQYDAACRVIARLVRERDEAKQALIQGGISAHTEAKQPSDGGPRVDQQGGEAMELDTEKKDAGTAVQPMAAMTAVFEETSERLGGKKRKASLKEKAAAAAGKEEIAQFAVSQSFTLHGAAVPGVTALDVDERAEGERLLLTGGADGGVLVFDANAGKIRDTLKGHRKKVTDVAFVHPAQQPGPSAAAHLPILSSSADHTVHLHTRVADSGHYDISHVWADHTAAITALTPHPSGVYFATASLDSSYRVYSLDSGTAVVIRSTPSPLTSLAFHPDGRILASTHQDQHLRIYDALQSQCVAAFISHAHMPAALAFSPNGYQAASGDDDGVVRVWDLRKVSGEKERNVATLQLGEGRAVGALSFDDSGGTLGVGVGADVVVVESKGWTEIARWKEHKDDVRGLRWGQHSHSLVTASKDRTVKLWQKPTP